MSKMDNLRAMREARYEQGRAQAAQRAGAPAPKARATTPRTEAADTPTQEPTAKGLCGHRSMNGRSCTREAGHAAKSHRYS